MDFLIPARTSRPGDDPIFSLNTEAKKRQAAGEKVINGTVGALLTDDGKLAVLPTIAAAIRENPDVVTAGYAPIAGSKDFLDAVAKDLLGEGDVLGQCVAAATPGGTGAIRHAIANFVEVGQTVLTSSYYWAPYRTLTDESDRHLTTFRMFDAEGKLDVTDLDSKLQSNLDAQGRALVILNSPCHNPTGYSFDEREWAGVTEVVLKHAATAPVSVLFDVAYARYASDESYGWLRSAAIAMAGKALPLFAWSASKSFLEYGQRVGAIVGVVPDETQRKQIQNALTYSCRGTWSNCNAGGMAAITRVTNTPELKAKVDSERDSLKKLLDARVQKFNALAQGTHLQYPRYDGGFFTTVMCKEPKEVAAKLRDEGIFLVPLSECIRVALCAIPEADLPKVVDALVRHIPA